MRWETFLRRHWPEIIKRVHAALHEKRRDQEHFTDADKDDFQYSANAIQAEAGRRCARVDREP